MLRRRRNDDSAPTSDPPRERTVRLLRTDEELQAAIERALAFKRRGVDAGQRRAGAYDRVLDARAVHLADVLPMESLRGSVG